MNLGQHFANGLVLGHAYALIAVGWTLLLGAARLVNFAHGQMYMLGAFMTWVAVHRLGLPYFLSIPFSTLVGMAVGMVMQRVMLRLTLEQNLLSMMIVTLGFGLIIEGVSGFVFGSNPQLINSALNDLDIYIGDVWITGRDAAVVVLAIMTFVALQFVLTRSRFGLWVRMVAGDPRLAQLGGLDVPKIYLGVFAFEGAAVAMAASVASTHLPILTSMGFEEVIITFVVVVLGGVGSVTGSYLAGVGLGLFTAFFGALVSPAYTTAAAFIVLIVILMVRPGGLAAAKGGA
jgi:branched-chain amino acid transport system permease protein